MNLFLTCGLGDFLAIEAFQTLKEKKDVRLILLATPAGATLKNLLPSVYPNLKKVLIPNIIWGPPLTPQFCVNSLADFKNKFPKELPPLKWTDHSTVDFATEVLQNKRHFHQSSTCCTNLTDIQTTLPKDYWVIHPYSTRAPTPVRDLTPQELSQSLTHIHQKSCASVLIGQGTAFTKKGTLNLINQLDFLTALEIVKKAKGFIGCASVFSVMAGFTVTTPNIYIKGHSTLRDDFHTFYYPQLQHKRVFPRITFPSAPCTSLPNPADT